MSASPGGRPIAGRVLDPATLPGGALLILKAARKAGGWWTWATRAEVLRPVKVVNAKDSPTGAAQYESRPFDRVLVKGRRQDGRRFVVPYLDGKAEQAYMLTRWHACLVPGSLLSFTNVKESTEPEPHSWRSESLTFDPVGISDLKGYMNAEGEL